jgi:hypothetical protein
MYLMALNHVMMLEWWIARDKKGDERRLPEINHEDAVSIPILRAEN